MGKLSINVIIRWTLEMHVPETVDTNVQVPVWAERIVRGHGSVRVADFLVLCLIFGEARHDSLLV